MNNQTIVCCVVALLLGMLLFHMLKGVCGCKLTEGQSSFCDGLDQNYCNTYPGCEWTVIGDPKTSVCMSTK